MMKRKLWWWGGGVVAVILGLAGLRVAVERAPTAEQVLRKAVEEMEFRGGAVTTGDEEGAVCHMVVRRLKDGTDEIWFQHTIPSRDFRTGTRAEHEEWIKADTLADIEELGIACAAPDPFFRPAYAQRYCWDCGGGGGCTAATCDATTHPIGPCTMGGVTCVITYFCCDWPCSGWPPC